MPVFQLTEELVFPPPELASEEGLLAVGGDLSQERLLLAYSMGIFPWYSEGDPLLWWSPDPRLVLSPGDFRVSRSLRRFARSKPLRLSMDTAFDRVVEACAKIPRPGQDGTWITSEMIDAYCALNASGHAHSVECWDEDRLVGGLYGVSLGKCFFGESMFSLVPNASKIALWALVEQLRRWDFALIDCQVHTEHLESLGAQTISRAEFCRLVAQNLKGAEHTGPWALDDTILQEAD